MTGVSAFAAARARMEADGAAEVAIESFIRFHHQLAEGEQGVIRERSIVPVETLPDAERLPEADAVDALERTVMVKLNGGLGTGMGMTRAKSLIEARAGHSFLDIIARQVLLLRQRTGATLPLVLMNSFATREDTLAELERHQGLQVDGLDLDFLQNRVPKLRDDDLHPVDWEPDQSLEWAPPGHGDLYTALAGSGMLGQLLERGFRWAFVSNADNLGAVLDQRILAWFAESGIPFLMEVADRTAADRKGGHLARRPDGGLILREVAQTDPADSAAFQDIERHRFFNTNNLWLDLEALAGELDAGGGVLDLPMIVNRKTVDPSDPDSTSVIQLESAMGAAIALFEGAGAVRVPRSRFAPVKSTSDLLAVRSDAYTLTGEGHVVLSPERDGMPPLVELDPAFYRLLADFDSRFPGGPPSLIGCDSLRVEGDVSFGSDVVAVGEAVVSAAIVGGRVSDGERIGRTSIGGHADRDADIGADR